MLNKEVYLRTSGEVCTQIASYFDVVDNCVSVADSNKMYKINPQTSYSPSPPIKQGSYTTVIISPNSDNTADIYNGFIKADMQITVSTTGSLISKLSSSKNFNFNRIWVGFKDARDAIEKYEIVCNGISMYTQNFACEESFLTACCSNDVTKKADVYSKARHKDIWSGKSGCRTGFIFETDKETTSNKTHTDTIHLKIDLRRFLPLSNIKYLPAFAGKIELRLYFSCAGLVYCPCGPSENLYKDPNTAARYKLEPVTNEFTQIGDEIKCWSSAKSLYWGTTTAAVSYYEIKAEKRTYKVDSYSVTLCQSIIPCFGLIDSVYNALVARYSNPSTPLIFPTQTISVYTTTTALKSDHASSTITITPRFVDAIFCLFPLKITDKTVFKNPLFESFYITAGNYGNIPAQSFGTNGNYPEFIEYCQNAMNMNGEQSGFNEEVITSLTNKSKYTFNTGLYSEDRTSFFIGLPTETDGSYQQGLSAIAPINFEMVVTQKTDLTEIPDPTDNTGEKKIKVDYNFCGKVETPPLVCLLTDMSISILVRANGQPPEVRIGNYDITSPE